MSWVDLETGETGMTTLRHEDPAAVREFYRQVCQPPAVIGLESSGSSQWFERLVQGLGYEVWHGDAAEIRRLAPRRQKNDDRDAELILELLVRGEFPRIFRPEPASLDVLWLLRLRHQLVKMRTMARNGLHAVAFNAGQVRKRRLGPKYVADLQARDMGSAALNRKRDEWLALERYLNERIDGLERELAALAAVDPRIGRLRTHPGIGLLTSLALVHTLGPVERFARGRQVVAYVGLDPQERSSGERKRYEGISKAGSKLLRFLLGEAAQTASRLDADLRRCFNSLVYRRGKAKATTAVARRLLVHCWIMLRDGIDYAEFRRRGQQRLASRRALALAGSDGRPGGLGSLKQTNR